MRIRTLFQLASLAFVVMPELPACFTGSLRAADSGYQIVERGQDYALFRKTTTTTDAGGNTVWRTNQFTLLENGLNYLDNGIHQSRSILPGRYCLSAITAVKMIPTITR